MARDAISAADLIVMLTGPRGFQPWDEDVVASGLLGFGDRISYADRVASAVERSGTRESVITGSARVGNHDVALIVGEFAFMGGTLSVASATRIVRAFDRAARLRLPLIGMPASAGMRMQEGVAAFVQMMNCAAAARRFRRQQLPYIVYLRDPTVGGTLASWASLAHVTFAEPQALIGFIGPRVTRVVGGRNLPRDVQVAENLLAHGLVDDLVPVDSLAERLSRVLAVLDKPASPARVAPPTLPGGRRLDGWAAVKRSRQREWPGLRTLLATCATQVTELRGDGTGLDDPGCLVALARLGGIPAIIVGHDRPPGGRGPQLGPPGYRKAHRGMELAQELGLPLVTVIDTPGAEISRGAEEGGLAQQIALCVATMTDLETPTLSLLLGEGCGGGALAMMSADRVVATDHSWLAPIAPEGASAILYGTSERAAEVASLQAVSATDLQRLGTVDVVVADLRPEDFSKEEYLHRVGAVAARELSRLVQLDPDERRRIRRNRLRPLSLGTP